MFWKIVQILPNECSASHWARLCPLGFARGETLHMLISPSLCGRKDHPDHCPWAWERFSASWVPHRCLMQSELDRGGGWETMAELKLWVPQSPPPLPTWCDLQNPGQVYTKKWSWHSYIVHTPEWHSYVNLTSIDRAPLTEEFCAAVIA